MKNNPSTYAARPAPASHSRLSYFCDTNASIKGGNAAPASVSVTTQ